MNYKNFKRRLEQAKTEETVKSIYAEYFNINYNTTDKHDTYFKIHEYGFLDKDEVYEEI